ncbi:MAG: alcohol dehydrogenase catalytic domain-containing protein [Bacteroidales bacterium]|nr:alcohol dehydrogenase catalytic domain-containing protein [Bacteroidales bacterium]
MKKMKAAVLTEYRKVEWKEVDVPEISGNEVLIKVGYACICGSDQHVFLGEFHPRTSVPLIQGHEFAGTVFKTGPAVKYFTVGDRVAVDPIIWCGHCPACKRKHYPACSTLKLVDRPRWRFQRVHESAGNHALQGYGQDIRQACGSRGSALHRIPRMQQGQSMYG